MGMTKFIEGTPVSFLDRREAGILLHITSLPGGHGVGDLGASAYQFVDWMVQAGLRYWQTLPLVPPGSGFSPYSSWSSLAANTQLIDLEDLVAQGLLVDEDLRGAPANGKAVDYPAVEAFKTAALKKAYQVFSQGRGDRFAQLAGGFASFRVAEPWADEAALYAVLSLTHPGAIAGKKSRWTDWGPEDRHPTTERLAHLQRVFAEQVEEQSFYQYLFHIQWGRLRSYANRQGVRLIGDVPIYVDLDSVDVWLSQHLFELDPSGLPRSVSGVPPDNFSATGQLWGHPLYAWSRHHDEGYAWWKKRMRRCLDQTDIVRIDHFRGFSAFWSVPFGSVDAVRGQWVKGPGISLFRALQEEFGSRLPVIAEDLGDIDEPVHVLKREAGLPGMCVLEFGFADTEDVIHHPDHHPEFSVAYTGTHDNETAVQWRSHMTAVQEERLARFFNHRLLSDKQFAWSFVELLFHSKAQLAVVPLQDLLALGAEARMNFPSTAEGNWKWRAESGVFEMSLAASVREALVKAGRWRAP
jgi:4-alpha-glucanotransferase